MLKQEQILLTPGTNEVEVLEISVGGYNFGINVLKVRSHDFPRRQFTRANQTCHLSRCQKT